MPSASLVNAVVARVEGTTAAVITAVPIGVRADRAVAVVRVRRRVDAAHIALAAVAQAVAVAVDAHVAASQTPSASPSTPSSLGSKEPLLQSSQLSPSVSAQTVAFAVVRVGRRIDAAHIVERAITQAIGVQVYAIATRAGALAGFDRALLVREAPFAGECAELDRVASLRSAVDTYFVASCADDCTVGILRDGVEPILARFGNTDRRTCASVT